MKRKKCFWPLSVTETDFVVQETLFSPQIPEGTASHCSFFNHKRHIFHGNRIFGPPFMALTKKMLSFQLRLKMGFVRVCVGRCERIRELRQMTVRRGRGGKGRRHMKAREREREVMLETVTEINAAANQSPSI